MPHRVVLGVGGGIAAYKAVSLLRLFTEAGMDVRVVPTAAALRFVGEPTWAALSHGPVTSDVWSEAADVSHVTIGRNADLVVVAPATADLMARAAAGIADDLLTNVLLTARCPVLLAPAMHTEMWDHPATRANVATLRSRAVVVLDPDTGRLAGNDTGRGRLPEPETVYAAARALLATGSRGALAGRHVVISAGGTREPLDPVRYLGNASSGRQGVALAQTALDRGARVSLVAGHVEVPLPPGVTVHRVGTADEMHDRMHVIGVDADVIVMAAAVADFKPAWVQTEKIKKGDGDPPPLQLVRTVDVLASLVAHRPSPGVVIVGFAAETGDAAGDVLHHARRKLLAKGCDFMVVNDVSGGRVFGAETNSVVVLQRDANVTEVVATVAERDKAGVARAIWDVVVPAVPPAATNAS